MMRIQQLRGWLMRLFGVFHRGRREQEFAAELESHLAFHIEDNLRAGMSPEEARRQALIKLQPAIYVPLLQNYAPDLTLHVRMATGAPAMLAAVRQTVQALDATLPVHNLQTLAEQKDGALYTERLAATLLSLFGLLALSLAAIGLYGVLSYAVTERTRELGIRLALGAPPRDLLRLFVGQGLWLTFIGLVIGTLAALAVTRLMTGLLFGVSATDPLTFVAIALLLVSVALLACWLPARRAMKVDPLIALRSE